jgi:hypothetical protein
MGMGAESWHVPFLAFSVLSAVVALACWWFFRRHLGGKLRLGPPFLRMVGVSVPLLVAVVVLFTVADRLHWPAWGTAIESGVLAAVVIAVIV